MIRYSLKCAEGHSFDSWFKSADAFEGLLTAGMVGCTTCGSQDVSKSLMAPAVAKETKRPLSTPSNPTEDAITKLRDEVEKNADYVGKDFATEARKIHDGDAPERNIWGETKPADAIKLIEDGIPVAPLPFVPRKQTN